MTRASSNIVIFFLMALLLTLAFTLWTALPIPPPANGFYNVMFIPFFGLYGDEAMHDAFYRVLPGFVLLGSLFCYCLHALLLNNMPRLTTRSARIAGLIFFFLIPIPCWWGCRLLHAAPENMAVFLILIFLMLALMPGVVIYSLPSTLPGTVPLLAHYLLVPLFFVSKHHFSWLLRWCSPDATLMALVLLESVMIFALLFFVYMPLTGHLVPRHRRLRELWRPAPLPGLDLTAPPLPIPPTPEDEY